MMEIKANMAKILYLYMIVNFIRATDCTCDTSAMTTTSATVYMDYVDKNNCGGVWGCGEDRATMPLDATDTWTWGYMLDFGVPTTVS